MSVGPKFAEFELHPETRPVIEFDVREARVSDAEAIAALSDARQGKAPGTSTNGFAQLLASGRAGVFVASDGAGLVGFGKSELLLGASAPVGWYLTGVVVAPTARRAGVGLALTRARLDWLVRRTSIAFYVASLVNDVSIALHERLGFVAWTDEFALPGLTFTGGRGRLFARRSV